MNNCQTIKLIMVFFKTKSINTFSSFLLKLALLSNSVKVPINKAFLSHGFNIITKQNRL